MRLKLLHLKNIPIFEQLRLEEALLRADDQNWLILNSGSPPAIIFGISGKQEEHISSTAHLPLVRRFSGGGTVVVDHNTLFVTLICNSSDAPCKPFPKDILSYNALPYAQIFGQKFSLKENDYALHDKKFGGNAQSLLKGRWLHHSTLLWDYDPKLMNLLKIPLKMPLYRNARTHDAFLTTIKDFFSSKEEFFEIFRGSFTATPASLDEAKLIQLRPHRQALTEIKPLQGVGAC